jgi:hypothetical protein
MNIRDKRVASWFSDSDGVWIKLADGYMHDFVHAIHVEKGESVRKALGQIVPCDASCCSCADQREQAAEAGRRA